MYSFRNREYHTAVGRWSQRDPLGYADELGLYIFERSQPSGNLDPLGLACGDCSPPTAPGARNEYEKTAGDVRRTAGANPDVEAAGEDIVGNLGNISIAANFANVGASAAKGLGSAAGAAIDAFAQDQADVSEVALDVISKLKAAWIGKHGFAVYIKVTFKKCVPCDPDDPCDGYEWEWTHKWHRCTQGSKNLGGVYGGDKGLGQPLPKMTDIIECAKEALL